MGRYGSNIRRIAQTDELTGRIRQAEQKISLLDKAEIPGARAIAYASGVTAAGSPGVTNPDQNGTPDNTGIFTDKNPMDKNGIDDTTTDGDDLLDGSKQLQKGEDVGAIRLKDCDSGERIDVRFNTGANEGESKFKHPPGWGTTAPQTDPSYLAGSVWTLSSGGTAYFGNSFNALVSAFKTAIPYLYCYTIEGGLVSSLTPDAGDALIQFTNTARTVGQAPVGGVQYAYISSGTPAGGQYGRVVCGTVAGDTTACAAAPPPQYTTWQEQDAATPHQLAFSAADGGFVSSSYDDGVPRKFDNDVGSGRGLNNLNLCTPTGDEVVVSALSDGTFTYFAQDGFGAPATDAKILHFDSDGKYLDILREDEYDYLKTTDITS